MTPIVGNIKDDDVVADCLDRYGSDVLDVLLKDRTTGRNIIWADDEYVRLGEGYGAYDEITVEKISAGKLIEPRVAKAVEQQAWRTREKAEVFTPSWLCKKMVDCLDDAFFDDEPAGFEGEGNTGLTAARCGQLAEDGRWKDYVDNRLLEITCGEAPFICSPYVATTGEFVPVEARVGFLDRKLNVVTRFASMYEEWFEWAVRAVQATYGYEYQGDNLLIARINVLNTVADFMRDAWEKDPRDYEAMRVADVVSWNLWQMDGLRGCAPSEWDLPPEPRKPDAQMSFFDMGLFVEESSNEEDSQTQMQFADKCVICDWRANTSLPYESLSEGSGNSMGWFYGVIGNPPYQETVEGNGRANPIYNHFMDEAYRVGEKVELITPARFLFNAGQTPKEWNRKMLEDSHLKVLHYQPNAEEIFANAEIKGGIAVTYRDAACEHDPVGVFVPFDELKRIVPKVNAATSASIATIVTGAVPYRFADEVRRDHPSLVDVIGASFDLRTNSLDKLKGRLFFEVKREDMGECAPIFGLVNKRRQYLYISRKYIEVPENFAGYKVLLPKASGNGDYGEVLAECVIAPPFAGHTQSFVSMGNFELEEEANSLLKYIKTKFARSLLGVLKVTQDITARVWEHVPLQDFTSNSDIDWSQSVAEIDAQLYAKYGLSREEIDFIESHVKEMS